MQQLRAEPVVSTVPPGVRTVVATMLPAAAGQAAPSGADDVAAAGGAGARTSLSQDNGVPERDLITPQGR